MSEQEKPKLEEDAKIARILGALLLIIIPTFGFYISSSLGKEWYFDYRVSDYPTALHGVGYGLIIAVIINGIIWWGYKKSVDRDLVNEWYDPQSGNHH